MKSRITGYSMPGMGGMEVLEHVKKEHPQVQVIILTGHGSDAEEVEAVAPLICEVMEGAFELRAPLKADLKIGDNWQEI